MKHGEADVQEEETGSQNSRLKTGEEAAHDVVRRLADIRFFFKHFPCGEASSGVAGVVLSAAPPLGGVSPFELSCTGLLISCVEAATLLCQSIVAATALTCMRSFI